MCGIGKCTYTNGYTVKTNILPQKIDNCKKKWRKKAKKNKILETTGVQ